MRNSFLRKQLSFAIVFLLVISMGCKRTQIEVVPDPAPTPGVIVPVNDAPQVTASVSGIVLDESNAPIASAVVTSGTATTTTNSNGMFILNNISLSKENGSVTVVKAGYFKGIRSFKTTAGKNHSVRLQMMARVLSGTVNAAAGGTVTSNGGAIIIFPANAFITSAGAAYTGTVNVYSRWIDPTAANLPFVIPGDLRGISTNGAENILETYGMVGAELADASGNVLKIATGKTATVSFPIPTSLTASAPATIVLWHFDDASARWKENGTATKTGSVYTAQVDKFSFWNCDVANANFINLDYTLINATTNSPLVSTSTRIKRVSDGSYGYGFTNNAGFVSGAVPKNEALILEVLSTCNTVIYTQNIGPFAVNASLGNISVTIPTSQYINFTGTVLNCNGAPVTNGYVSLYATGGNNGFISTSATGTFSFSILNCSGTNLSYTYQAVDYATAQQSTVFTGTATVGTINLSNISACGTAAGANVYVAGGELNAAGIRVAKFWKNGVATNLTNGANDANANSVYVVGSDVYVAGYELVSPGDNVAKLWKNGVATNLTNGNTKAFAYSVFALGNDIFVAGYEENTLGIEVAKLWKNGIATSLTTGVYHGRARSIFVSGIDVYVAGEETNQQGFIVAKLWKNGITTSLSGGTGIASAYSVYVSGIDVYVAGQESTTITGRPIAKLWKNGVATNLTTGTYEAYSNSVFVSGTDVYAAGRERSPQGNIVAKLWKNGIPTSLSAATSEGYANSVFVLGTDVYVVGQEFSTGNAFVVSKLWKNGVATNLSTGIYHAYSNSVFVK